MAVRPLYILIAPRVVYGAADLVIRLVATLGAGYPHAPIIASIYTEVFIPVVGHVILLAE